MKTEKSYRNALVVAVLLHIGVAGLLLTEINSPRPVLTPDVKNEAGSILAKAQHDKAQPDIVKAVSVDNREVMQAVARLKQEREIALKLEQSRQKELAKQAEIARKERLLEQQRLTKLKDEAAKLALERKKQLEDEQKHLKRLAEQKEQETKRLDELKQKQHVLEEKQRQDLEKHLALKKKIADDEAREVRLRAERAQTEKVQAEKVRAEQEQAEKAQAELARQKQVALQQAAEDASKKAKIAGEVNKYKAMIVNAISQRWILPENVDRGRSSQFRIRLAPDGAVLDVTLTRSSGDPILDRSAQTAIYKASPLPVPADPIVFNLFRDISLTVRPENIRG